MNLLSKLRLFGLSAFVSVAMTGCVFTLGGDGESVGNTGSTSNGSVVNPNSGAPKTPGADCGFNGVFSQTLECVCKPGYSWCDPTLDPGPRGRNHCCVGTAPSGSQGCVSGSNNMLINDPQKGEQCVCIQGFDWCDQTDQKNLNCCAVNDSNTNPGTLPNPNESCDPTQVTSWCTHTESQGPVGSKSFNCVDGKWVDATAGLDEQCRVDGFDFAYGCTHVPGNGTVQPFSKILCGFGAGTPCESTMADECSADETQLHYCLHKRLSSEQCAPKPGETCKTADNKEFEFGKCGSQGGRLSCLCYDGDAAGSTGGSTDSGTGTGTGTGT